MTFAEHSSLWRLWALRAVRAASCRQRGFRLLRLISAREIEQRISQTAGVNEENAHDVIGCHAIFSHITCWLVWFWGFKRVYESAIKT